MYYIFRRPLKKSAFFDPFPPLYCLIEGILAFHDFTTRDPHYFVILFVASFHDFEEKNQKKNQKIKKILGFIFLNFLFIVFCLDTVIVIL